MQQVAGQEVLVETELTLGDIVQWFVNNPEGTINQFLTEHAEAISTNALFDGRNRPHFQDSFAVGFDGEIIFEDWSGNRRGVQTSPQTNLVRAILRSDTPEGDPQVHDLIRLIWERSPDLINEAVLAEYGTFTMQRGALVQGGGSHNLPDYLLDLYLETSNVHLEIAQILAMGDSPKAGEILERWAPMVSDTSRQRLERMLEHWQIRNTIRQIKMQVFQDLVAGNMSPDDLLLPQPVWVWRDGRYVQAE